MPLVSGTRLGSYKILAAIGAGGMGEVYKAWDTRLDRIVAIKVLPADRLGDPESNRRFLREARAASALNHPNIVTVYDVGSGEGTSFIVMEWVDGQTLSNVIAEKQLSQADALKFAIQAADALAKAHAAGIIHRDLKPGNIMVNTDSQIKILDFGLAKVMSPGELCVDDDTRTMASTEKGTILGTVAYMSPEQAEGKRLDTRSDIFSFGAVLYEMITSRRAFQGDSKIATLAAILNQEPAPLNSPLELKRLVERCLRKDPSQRFQSMTDVRLALTEAQEEPNQRNKPARHVKRDWLVAGTLVGLALVVAIVTMLWRGSGNRGLLRPTDSPLTALHGEELSPTFSPDATQVAFQWDGEEGNSPGVYVKVLGSETTLRLTRGFDIGPAWSPDGRWIAFTRIAEDGRLELRLIAPVGGPERMIAELHLPQHQTTSHSLDLTKGEKLAAWFPDGKSLVVSDATGQTRAGLFRVSIASGDRRQLTFPSEDSDDREPAVAPEGQMLAFIRGKSLFVLKLNREQLPQGEPRQLPLGQGVTPNWVPTGDAIVLQHGHGFLKVPLSGAQAEPSVYVGDAFYNGFALSSNGKRLAYSKSSADFNIYRQELLRPGVSAGRPRLFLSSTRMDLAPRYSPDGTKIVFTSNRSGAGAVWIANADGSAAVPLIEGFLGAWSPDGQQIAFTRESHGKTDLYTIGLRGGQARLITTTDKTLDYPALWFSWSRDGKWIYFPAIHRGKKQSFRVPVRGGEPIPIAGLEDAQDVKESSDGRFLFYRRDQGVWRRSITDGSLTSVIRGPVSGFTLVVTGIYFVTSGSKGDVFEYFEFTTGRRRVMLTTEKGTVGEPSVDANGRFLLFTQPEGEGADLMLVENFY